MIRTSHMAGTNRLDYAREGITYKADGDAFISSHRVSSTGCRAQQLDAGEYVSVRTKLTFVHPMPKRFATPHAQ